LLIDKVFNAGDLVLADGLVARNVTNDGSRMGRDGFKATGGGPVSESRIVILRVRDSQVAEYWSLAYRAALGQQLGLRGGTAGGARLGV
jgi:predicted ester cyclase